MSDFNILNLYNKNLIEEIKNIFKSENTIEIIDKYPFCSIKEINDFFSQNNINFRKSLGQNFLIDKNILKKLFFSLKEKLDVLEKENIYCIEIGGGSGNLTCFLKDLFKKIYVVEYDKFFGSFLEHLFENDNVEIIKNDVIQIDFEKIFNSNSDKKFIIVGAIPYNISSKIIELLAKIKNKIIFAFLIVQKEYFQRLYSFEKYFKIEKDKKEKKVKIKDKEEKPSFLTVFVNYHFEVKKNFDISKNSFYPIPKVDSTSFFLFPKKNLLDNEKEKIFFDFVSFIFSFKRKIIINSAIKYINLKSIKLDYFNKYYKASNNENDFNFEEIISKLKENEKLKKIKNWPLSRPEDLNLHEWIELFYFFCC